MQLKCIAIDDEPLALELIKQYVDIFPDLQLVECFDDALSGKDFLSKNHIDLLFIDIDMPDLNGLDLVKALHEKPMIIFTTAHKKFAFEGFELNALDYLLKPINLDRFSKAVEKALEYNRYKHSSDDKTLEAIFVYSEYRLIKILIGDIEYIESLDDYIKIHLTTGKPILTLMTLKGVIEKLPSNKFKRIHRSFIVAIEKVQTIKNKKVQLLCKVQLPISNSFIGFIDEWKGLNH